MAKTIKNIDWIKLVLVQHQPYTLDIGTQRDPEKVVTCNCQSRTYPRNSSFPKYTDHILNVIRSEFSGIFEYNENVNEDT